MVLAVRFHELGGPEVLRFDDIPLPEPGPAELRLRVAAIGLNRAEVNFRRGTYIDKPRSLPCGLGYEAAGVVTAVGPDVTGFAVGDPVSVVPAFSQNDYGTYGTEVVVPVAAVVRRPAEVDPVISAAAWMQYLTPYGALVDIGGMRAGDHVVVTAATSSVGLAAIQLARLVGALPIAVIRSSDKADAAKAAGAVRVVVNSPDLVPEVLEETDGRGADFVFDAVAGPGVRDLARATATGGQLIVHGTLSGEPTPFPGTEGMRALVMRSYTLFEITRVPERLRRAERFIGAGLASGALRPVVDRTFDLADIVAAHEYLESGAQVGKVVVTVGEAS
ncbi:zinc-dependent alcohol dehydrogenase family protein [Saccharothrix deserti]|uniref:zinc-dependent alcohol dehydrogenase family protein n=1 Tax=Saccharothrix deserti TaxID=2593674 RepID=UPI00131AF359|nr:zinc-dependent alcohol dehydrogenase family protein [Saccharothrix deserti]